ncbi:MAG: polysaccharide biosynthesis C-terminal domain-containing protein [Clostridiaceae bacterium]|nr:polysaccharide biosynthesis C-terminal domain-containing protein [Clostridiaceae bacterium]
MTVSSKYCLLIGYLFTCVFLLFGKEFGTFLFHSPQAGEYIYLLSWLCPFLYLSTTFTSIINGLGQTQLTFLITAVCLAVKIYFLAALVPKFGIQAYLVGSLVSQIGMTLLEALYLRKYLHIKPISFFLIPGISLSLAGVFVHGLYRQLPIPQNGLWISVAVLSASLILCILYVWILKATGCIDKKDIR